MYVHVWCDVCVCVQVEAGYWFHVSSSVVLFLISGDGSLTEHGVPPLQLDWPQSTWASTPNLPIPVPPIVRGYRNILSSLASNMGAGDPNSAQVRLQGCLQKQDAISCNFMQLLRQSNNCSYLSLFCLLNTKRLELNNHRESFLSSQSTIWTLTQVIIP